ncbi:RHS repeat domain-containing protein, partial [Pseudomonas sp. IT-P100]|uniref:RHS repeat domain-containing protein n=1 Tax=Pseudomonas sp. IT-P100 TaxID=3026452 RepID=UPI0039E17C9B
WDGRGNQRQCEYDDQQRPVAVTEQRPAALPCVVDRFTYGDSDAVVAERNQCGLLIRHDDPAGSQILNEYGLAGSALVESRRFLNELETPDWPLDIDVRDEWLEEQAFVTRHSFHPTGEIERQTDAMGNVRTFDYDVAGKLSETSLLLAGEGRQAQCLVSDIRYNAHDQIERETAGNGVQTRSEYDVENGRLMRLVAAVGNQPPVQDLNYTYDAVGNIVEMEDKAQPVTWFNNQRIDPINHYRYDSQSQLVEASGWEVSTPSHGPALPDLLPTPLDPNQRRNYTQRFEYDAAGNLITRHHSGVPGFSMFTSARSNRSLAQRDDGSLPGESQIESGFDACGNQRELQRGQAMTWDIRNQLSRVTLVKRVDEPDDYECYAYDRPGHRLRKVHVSQTHRRTLGTEVRYLPNLEIHRQADGEVHHVISAEAGRCSVRALHWPEGTQADQLRYSLCDHLGSSTMELDHEAGVLTQEHYYPFGGTACWAGKSALVAKYKTIRYSGKERDATGLYYYGYRYYAPWLQRWVNPDPFGVLDGLNVYRSLNNNPIVFLDFKGAAVLHWSWVSSDDEGSQVRRDRKLVTEYEVPNMRPGEQLLYYLEQSRPGNVFTGIISLSSGEVNIYPLKIERRKVVLPVEGWKDNYRGIFHNGGEAIMHGRDGLVSHLQAINIYSWDVENTIGFTFRDVRALPHTDTGCREIPAIEDRSASLNSGKTYNVPDTFSSVGNNKEDFDFAKAEAEVSDQDPSLIYKFDHLPIEVKVELVSMFVRVSDSLGENGSSFRQLFAAELLRPELQVPEVARAEPPLPEEGTKTLFQSNLGSFCRRPNQSQAF